ncbi:MAG TPA: helix-turn-helix domain-containing protein [Bradyrhizobium sp.]|nr:helix-turn-helix domain-containing protein [Bradyrhizobium sp.]
MINQVDATTKLRVCEAASYLRVSKSWLDKRRVTGGGPPYMKFGRRVVYDMADLDGWAANNRRRHTAEVAEQGVEK